MEKNMETASLKGFPKIRGTFKGGHKGYRGVLWGFIGIRVSQNDGYF